MVRLAVYESTLKEFRTVELTAGVSTIVRRLDMQAVPLRCMMVVCNMRKMRMAIAGKKEITHIFHFSTALRGWIHAVWRS